MTDEGHYRAYGPPKRLGQDRLDAVGQANDIVREYQARGYQLTLRQLYYQHVARGLIPNTQMSYNRLGALVSDGRMAGLISWTAIEDRTRSLRGLSTVSGPDEALARALRSYRTDLWADQPWRPEVWVEKDALSEVVGAICDQLRVDYFPCRGYVSMSEMWNAGQRMAARVRAGQRPIVFHLGDHDPSGLDMTRDNSERLSLFAGTPVMVVRLALNIAQVEQYDPPPNPAKLTDSRYETYSREFGTESWELDALDPQVIRDLIDEAVRPLRDEALWAEALAREVADREAIGEMVRQMGGDPEKEEDDDGGL